MEVGETILEVDPLDALEHQIWPCGACRFFEREEPESNQGECRIGRPALGELPNPYRATTSLKPVDLRTRMWPVVLDDDWCGESLPSAAVLAKMREEHARSAEDEAGEGPDSECKEGCGCSNAINKF